jgi:flagellar hook-associated protein 3 FlgL
MALRVTTMMTARSTVRDLQGDLSETSRLQRKMSSGKEITRPSDNPYGASRALGLRGELEGLRQYQRNVNDGTAWLNSSDAALSKIGDAVLRARELLVQGGSDSAGPRAREAIASEIDQLVEMVKQEGNVQYAGRYVFAGTATETEPYALGGADRYNGNTDTIRREIGPSVQLDLNVTLDGLLGDGQPASDNLLLDTLRDVADHLRANDGPSLRGTDLQRLDANFDTLNQLRAEVGARSNRLTVASGRLASLDENSQGLLTTVEDADTVRTLIEYTTQQAAYNAALKAGANVVQASLLDFLR